MSFVQPAIIVVLVVWAVYHTAMETKQDQRIERLEKRVREQ